MDKESLDGILERHRLWRAGIDGGERADLYGADLVEANLEGVNLRGADLVEANLEGANLSCANLFNANLEGVNLRGADLVEANLEGANLEGVNLNEANLRGASLYQADLEGVNLRGAHLVAANLSRANLSRANLSRANLSRANLLKANLDRANLDGANLKGTIGLVKTMGVECGNIYWKRFNYGLRNNGYQFKVGMNYLRKQEIFASDERVMCSYPGFHFASRSWCRVNYPERPLEAKIRIPEGAQINEPWATDGKASADMIEILQVFDVKTREDVTDKFR